MIFLINHTPQETLIERFSDEERAKAWTRRLALEMEFKSHSVFLLQADSEAQVRKTHGRYFL